MESSLFLVNDVTSVNCETRKVIFVIRDLPSLIAVNCVYDPPYGPSLNHVKFNLIFLKMFYANAATTLQRKENYSVVSVSVEELCYYNF